MNKYPEVYDEDKVGDYQALTKAGGGYVWDEVLEYRVWCHPGQGAEDLENGNDYFYVFNNFEEANQYHKANIGTEEPLALILQREYIDEPEYGKYIHAKEERITEWPVEFLSRPRRNENTLLNFFASDAPANRIDIIRGLNQGESLSTEEIFVSEINETIERAIIIDGDEHTVWAYLLKMVNEEQELLFEGFICSRGTIVDESTDVNEYIDKGFQPPLLRNYRNEFSMHKNLTNEDFEIIWEIENNRVKVLLKKELYLIMDYKHESSYSKSISNEGPYGKLINEYEK